jgi:hypothetical protein
MYVYVRTNTRCTPLLIPFFFGAVFSLCTPLLILLALANTPLHCRYDSGGKQADPAFGFEPSAALLKAVLVNSAKSLNGVEPKPTTTTTASAGARRRLTLLQKQQLYEQVYTIRYMYLNVYAVQM